MDRNRKGVKHVVASVNVQFTISYVRFWDCLYFRIQDVLDSTKVKECKSIHYVRASVLSGVYLIIRTMSISARQHGYLCI